MNFSNLDNCLLPLSRIAREINKSPKFLAKLARDGAITASKKRTKWYANKEQVVYELRRLLWSETKFRLSENLDELYRIFAAIFRFMVIYVVMWKLWEVTIKPFADVEIVNSAPRSVIVFIMTLFSYCLYLCNKIAKAITYANNIFKEIKTLYIKTKDLNERVKLLEDS